MEQKSLSLSGHLCCAPDLSLLFVGLRAAVIASAVATRSERGPRWGRVDLGPPCPASFGRDGKAGVLPGTRNLNCAYFPGGILVRSKRSDRERRVHCRVFHTGKVQMLGCAAEPEAQHLFLRLRNIAKTCGALRCECGAPSPPGVDTMIASGSLNRAVDLDRAAARILASPQTRRVTYAPCTRLVVGANIAVQGGEVAIRLYASGSVVATCKRLQMAREAFDAVDRLLLDEK